MPPVIDKRKCVNCGKCADICCMDVFKISEKDDSVSVRYPDECWHCRACVMDCPKRAIKMRYPLSQMMLRVPVKEES